MEVISPFTPKDWRQLRLRDISRISSGTTPPRSMSDKYFSLSGTNWLKTKDLNNAEIFSTEETLTDAAFEDCSIRVYEVNTIFVAMYGGFQQIGRTGIGKIPLTVNQAISAIEVSDAEVVPKYIQHWLNNRINGWRRFAASSRKDPNITRTDVLAFPIALPCKFEQIAICDMVLHWDRAITICGKLVSTKKELRKGLMQQFLSGKQRFPEFNDRWIQIKLKDVAERVIRKNNVNNTNVLTISAQLGLVNQKEYYNKRIASKDLSNYYLVKNGEFAYNKSYSAGYPYGAIKRLDFYDAGVTSSLYICFKVNNPECDKDFFTHFFEAGMLNHGIYRIAQEGARNHGLLNISVHDFFDIELTIPGLQEQQKIAATLNAVDKELQILNKKLDALKEQKKGLMQQLLTGKKRIKVKDVA